MVGKKTKVCTTEKPCLPRSLGFESVDWICLQKGDYLFIAGRIQVCYI